MTPDNTRELIAELREQSEITIISNYGNGREWAEDKRLRGLYAKAADALAALTTPQEGDAREPALNDATEKLDDVILAHVLKVDLPIPSFDNRRRALCTCGESLIYEGEYIALSWHRDHLADAILAAFPVLSRDIAGEVEAEADERKCFNPAQYGEVKGLRRAAEIVRNGR